MPRACSVCISPDHDAVDEALARRATYVDVSRQHGLSEDALRRHWAHAAQRRSLTKVEVVRASAPEDEGGIDLRARLQRYVRQMEDVHAEARSRGRFAESIQALRTATQMMELYAKVTGELDASPKTNITVVPTAIIERLNRRVEELQAERRNEAMREQARPALAGG